MRKTNWKLFECQWFRRDGCLAGFFFSSPQLDLTADVNALDLAEWEGRIDEQIDGLQPEVVRIRRHLHAHPEPSGEELLTTQFVRSRLDESGIETRTYQNDDGLTVGLSADLSIGKPANDAPLIAIRCDMDALRMPDAKEVEYKSTNDGVTHACGHDAHTAIVLGLGLMSSRLRNGTPAVPSVARGGNDSLGGGIDGLPGQRLRLIFQPAEETSQGARWLVAQGAMEGVDGILGLHVDPERPVGEVGIRYGFLTAFCDEIDIAVKGHGGHSARPHHTTDPIAATAQLITSLYQQLPRSVDSRDASVFSVGQVTAGYAPNVIPEISALRGSLRSTTPESRTTLKHRIEEIAAGIAKSTRSEIDVCFGAPLNAVDNHPAFAAALERAAQDVLGDDHVKLIDRPSLGGEDFSEYLGKAPGALMRLGCAVPGIRQPFLHAPDFDLDERCLAIGMKILFRAATTLSDELRANDGGIA